MLQGQSMNGLRRSFLCRVKLKGGNNPTTPETDSLGDSGADYSHSMDMIRLLHSAKQTTATNQQYSVLHCSGFIRELSGSEKVSLNVDEEGAIQCLVAIARLQPFSQQTEQLDPVMPESNDSEFVARIGLDGKFTYVDQRVLSVLGYVPQDLVGEVCYQYYHPDDMHRMSQLHQNAIKYCRTPMPTVQYRFLSKRQQWVWLAGKAFCFINPYSQQVEYIIFTNVLLSKATVECSEGEGEPPVMSESLFAEEQQSSQQVTPPSALRERIGNPNPLPNNNSPHMSIPSNTPSGSHDDTAMQVFHNSQGFPPGRMNDSMYNGAQLGGGQMATDSPSQFYQSSSMVQRQQPPHQDAILNLLKDYNPEQIGTLFDQEVADPLNIQMSLPNMDIFD